MFSPARKQTVRFPSPLITKSTPQNAGVTQQKDAIMLMPRWRLHMEISATGVVINYAQMY